MEKLDIRGLKERARDTLANTTPDYRRLVALHSAIMMGILFFVALANFVVGRIEIEADGLASLGVIAMLSTAQSFITTVTSFLVAFWQAGVLFTSLQIARRKRADFPMLTQGFHRLGVLLRFEILMAGIMLAVMMVALYGVVAYMLMVPMPKNLMTAMSKLPVSDVQDPYAVFSQIPREMWNYVTPKLLILLAIMFTVTILLSYRFRMCQYAILDDEHVGARMSMGISNRLTKGYKWDLFKLDLSFWWYFGIQFLLALLADMPVALAKAGVQMPIPTDVLALITNLVYSGLTVLLAYFAGAYVQTTNALAYEDLCARQQALAVIPETEDLV